MCGIVGIISLEQKLDRNHYKSVERMTNSLYHRGPTQQDVKHFSHVSIGNTRLAVMDRTQRSKLPISNNDESIWLCYNGEISNYIELENEYSLREKYTFKGNSDSEVLLHLYEELGVLFLSKLSGMFACFIYDKNKNQALLARDFFGINPVFYWENNKKLYFASEMKAFYETSDFTPHVNHQAIFDYMTLAYIPGAATPYSNVKELRGGHYIEFDLNRKTKKQHQFYQKNTNVNHDICPSEAKRKTYSLLKESVYRHMRSDAPLGSTLSGGIDTSGIVCLANELGQSKDLHTFSIKMAEDSFDESYYQRLVAKKCQTIHHEIHVGPTEIAHALYEHVAFLDEPNANGACIPSYILANRAKKYVDVMLNGEGGDELFNAYDTHKAYLIKKIYSRWTPSYLKFFFYWLAHNLPSDYRKLSFDFKAKRFTEGANLHPADAHIYWRHCFTNEEKDLLFRTEDSFSDTYEQIKKIYNDINAPGLNKLTYIDMEFYFHDDLMVKNDRMFMANSIESRFPLVDRFLYEYVSSIPPEIRVQGLKMRHLEKQALKNVLPQQIYKRGSFGLEMPHSIWFLNSFKSLANKYFNKSSLEKIQIINPSIAQKMWQLHQQGRKDYGRALWSIFIYQIWHELFIETDNHKKIRQQVRERSQSNPCL